MLRTSSYTIYVDLPSSSTSESDSDVLLVHGYSGAHDKVSRPVATFLRSLGAKKPAQPLYGEWSADGESVDSIANTLTPPDATSDRLVDHLIEQGYLTDLSVEEEEALFGRLAEKLHERALRQAPSYIFMPTYDCNLRCGYCYQDHMRTDCSFHHLLRSLRPSLVDRIFDALPSIEAHHGLDPQAQRRRSFGLFGGEPLLAATRPTVERILERARDLGECDFWAVTNGTEIDAYEDLLGPQGIARLQITLDGTAAMHDARRVYADGSGSYERIARNLERAMGLGVDVSVRLNVDRSNVDRLVEVAEEFMARGWGHHPRFSAYVSPVRAGNGKTDATTTLSSWELDRRMAELRQEHPNLAVIDRPDESLRARARKLFDSPEGVLPSLKPSFCGAHDRMYIFDPFGDIYACWERTGDPNVRVGRVLPDGEVELKTAEGEMWRSRTIASNPVCRRCRFALHCGGGCAVLALGKNGKFNSNYCDGFAQRFRASVAEAYLAHEANSPVVGSKGRVCDL